MFAKLIIVEAHFILHSLFEGQKGILYREHQSIAAGNVSIMKSILGEDNQV